MSDFAVETVDLVRTFKDGEVRALAGVSLHVPRGQVFGLLGPNGSGKTTMIRILSTILSPTSGTATVNGFNVATHADEVRRSIGLAGQSATVDENLTGFENLRMVGMLNHLPRNVVIPRARKLLEDFGLSDAANRTCKTYSGGMRRRLDVAAALVADPPLLFLDEPTTGLDPQSRQDLWSMIERLVEGGVTVLLTTQYLEEADRLAHQLVVLDHGHIIAEGTPQELKTRLGATVLSLTFANTSDATRGVEIVRDLSEKPANVDGSTVELTINAGPAAAAEAMRRLDGAGLTITGLMLREPSLDDVFLDLTGHKTEEDTADAMVSAGRSGRRSHS
ncbi:MAG TPA: ATP-binding cassette domain-containing protein [Acidimicrobiales bacterium]|nr:ATP-binding cassette domain-containing protein [Acidimicrobiales bacterium]